MSTAGKPALLLISSVNVLSLSIFSICLYYLSAWVKMPKLLASILLPASKILLVYCIAVEERVEATCLPS